MTPGRRRTLDYVLAAVLVALPVIFLQANLKNPSGVNAFDRVVLKISAPIQNAVAWVIDGVAGAWHHYVWLVDVQKENDELRRENDRLHHQLAELGRKAKDGEALEALVDLRTKMPSQTIGARIVASSLNPSFRVTRVVLDRGQGDVAPGMPVIAASGVVGRIQRVYGSYADVTLAVDPQSSIDVVLPRTNARGVLKGLGGDNRYACRIAYVVRNDDVKEGDLVVTSGLGGVFPRDVPIGRVKKVEKAAHNIYQEVEVEPAVDFAHLHTVLVVLSPPPPPDPGVKQRKPEPAFGAQVYK